MSPEEFQLLQDALIGTFSYLAALWLILLLVGSVVISAWAAMIPFIRAGLSKI